MIVQHVTRHAYAQSSQPGYPGLVKPLRPIQLCAPTKGLCPVLEKGANSFLMAFLAHSEWRSSKEINFAAHLTCVTILSERSGKDHRETEGPNMGAKVIIYGKAG